MRPWNALVGITVAVVFAMVVPTVSLADEKPAEATAVAEQTPPGGAALQQVHATIETLRSEARAQIRALLTEEQQAQFDALPLLRGPADGSGHGKGRCGADRPGDANAAPDGKRGQTLFAHLAQKLSLTDAQRAQVQTIMDSTHTAMQARERQARSDFRAFLTPEQVTTLDQLKATSGPGRPSGLRRHRMEGAGLGDGPLQLTDEQKTQAKSIFTQLRTDMQKLHADSREQIRDLLTDEQKTQFDAARPADGPGSMGKDGPRMGPGGPGRGKMHGPSAARRGDDHGALLDRLSATLKLTDEQRASVKTILDNLRNAVRERVQQARTKSATTPAASPVDVSADAGATP